MSGERTAMERAVQGGPAAAKASAAMVPGPKAPAPAADPAGTPGAVISLTPAAVAHLRALIEEQSIPEEERHLRIAVRAGGCSGFSYELGFDARKPGDVATTVEGMSVIVDPASLPRVAGMSVDFVDTVAEQGFKIVNPNATASCGCGKSFQA